jgi:uncharacterized membrane protein YvbJ
MNRKLEEIKMIFSKLRVLNKRSADLSIQYQMNRMKKRTIVSWTILWITIILFLVLLTCDGPNLRNISKLPEEEIRNVVGSFVLMVLD